MLTLTIEQEKQLRQAIINFINKYNNTDYVMTYPSSAIYGYQIKKQSHGERIYFKKRNLYTNKYYFEPNITTTQAKVYFNII